MVLKHRNSLQKRLCPVIICPYLCSSERGAASAAKAQRRAAQPAPAAAFSGEEPAARCARWPTAGAYWATAAPRAGGSGSRSRAGAARLGQSQTTERKPPTRSRSRYTQVPEDDPARQTCSQRISKKQTSAKWRISDVPGCCLSLGMGMSMGTGMVP